ncbi:unnamed protein product, partial [Nesidiocoris tenuis]
MRWYPTVWTAQHVECSGYVRVTGCRVTGGRRCNIHYWRFVRYTFRENHREPNGGQT